MSRRLGILVDEEVGVDCSSADGRSSVPSTGSVLDRGDVGDGRRGNVDGGDAALGLDGTPSIPSPEAILPAYVLPALEFVLFSGVLGSSSSRNWLYWVLICGKSRFRCSSPGISGKSRAFPCLNSELSMWAAAPRWLPIALRALATLRRLPTSLFPEREKVELSFVVFVAVVTFVAFVKFRVMVGAISVNVARLEIEGLWWGLWASGLVAEWMDPAKRVLPLFTSCMEKLQWWW